MAHREYSHFKLGFSIKGFGANEVGTDLIQTYKSLSAWENDDEKEVGTPIQIDTTSSERELKICPDGEIPDGFLEVRVGKKLSDYEMMLNLHPVNEVRPGDPVTYVKYVPNAILETKLFKQGYSPTAGDYIYVEGGEYVGTDPLNGEGKFIGKVLEVNDDFADILLKTEVKSSQIIEKVEKINITAPADDSEQQTGFTLPEGAVVTNVLLSVSAEEDTGISKTIDVGTDSEEGGDADGFLEGVSVANDGLVKGTLAHNAVTLGALLQTDTDESSDPVPDVDITSGGKEITFTAGSADFEELDADIYVFYYDLA